VRARGARRALRVRPTVVQLDAEGDDALLCFELPAGSYATVLVEESFGPAEDASTRATGVC
jgi:tRNA(Glu) U13 pseudouridine synthase TruD